MPGDAALIAPGATYGSIGRAVEDIALANPLGRRWWIALAGALALTGLLVVSLAALFIEGVGIWGNNIPVTWALDIVSYDWWIGISCGGLLVSATLVLLGAEFRGAINRLTETVALISAIAAGIYPIIHLGRPWLFYWNLPYFNTLLLWPQFRSPLVWDAFDIIAFLVICAAFWFVGLLPDLASLRDRAVSEIQTPDRAGRRRGTLRAQLYGLAALGWRGSAVHWARWLEAYRTLAVLGILLVVSLQTGAAVMFAGSLEPGWHDTLLPVSYLFAALFEGVGVVAACIVILRAVLGLGNVVTARHLDTLAWLMLGLGLANLYCYGTEYMTTALHGDAFEQAVQARRFAGPHAWAAWAIVLCALLPVQLFWIAPLRRSPFVVAIVGLLVAAGMFGDHFMVIVVTLQHDFMPSMAHPYALNIWELTTFAGSVGLFLVLLLLAVRFVPILSIVALRSLDTVREHGHGA